MVLNPAEVLSLMIFFQCSATLWEMVFSTMDGSCTGHTTILGRVTAPPLTTTLEPPSLHWGGRLLRQVLVCGEGIVTWKMQKEKSGGDGLGGNRLFLLVSFISEFRGLWKLFPCSLNILSFLNLGIGQESPHFNCLNVYPDLYIYMMPLTQEEYDTAVTKQINDVYLCILSRVPFCVHPNKSMMFV